MLLNADKSNYMLITRAVGDYSTRLQLNNNNLHRVKSVKLLGIWLTDPGQGGTPWRFVRRRMQGYLSSLS